MRGFLCSLFVLCVSTTTIYVSPTGSNSGTGTNNDPFQTIQFAVNHCESGDTIGLLPGVYSGTPNYPVVDDDNFVLSFVAVSGFGSVTWEGTGEKDCIDLSFSEYCNITVDSLIFQSCFHGIVTYLDDMIIKNTQFISSENGAALYDINRSNWTIENVISDCPLVLGGARNIYVTNLTSSASSKNNQNIYSASSVTLKSSSFDSLTLALGSQAVLVESTNFVNSSALFIGTLQEGEISNTTFRDSAVALGGNLTLSKVFFSDAPGTAIQVGRYSNITLDTCTFSNCGNQTALGGAINLPPPSSLTVFNSQFEKNIAKKGGALFCEGAEMDLQNCLFDQNEAVEEGGAIYCSPACAESGFGNTFTNNTEGAPSPCER